LSGTFVFIFDKQRLKENFVICSNALHVVPLCSENAISERINEQDCKVARKAERTNIF